MMMIMSFDGEVICNIGICPVGKTIFDTDDMVMIAFSQIAGTLWAQ